jgi:hypothetical protein
MLVVETITEKLGGSYVVVENKSILCNAMESRLNRVEIR